MFRDKFGEKVPKSPRKMAASEINWRPQPSGGRLVQPCGGCEGRKGEGREVATLSTWFRVTCPPFRIHPPVSDILTGSLNHPRAQWQPAASAMQYLPRLTHNDPGQGRVQCMQILSVLTMPINKQSDGYRDRCAGDYYTSDYPSCSLQPLTR